jgi:hypothetical protein
LAPILVSFVPILLAIVSIGFGQLIELVLLLFASFPWIAFAVWPAWKHYRVVLAVVLTIAFGASGLASQAWYDRSTTAAMPTTTAPSSLAAAARQLQFTPAQAPIPYCAAFSGTGAIPVGDALLIFDEAADANGDPVPGASLNYDGSAEEVASRGWELSNIEIGFAHSEGQHVLLTGLLVPSGVPGFINSVPGAENNGWPPTVLVLGVVATRIVVVRSADATSCTN